jgi:hypothetical protein
MQTYIFVEKIKMWSTKAELVLIIYQLRRRAENQRGEEHLRSREENKEEIKKWWTMKSRRGDGKR